MTLPSGAAWIDIALEQVDKKSPVDDDLETSIAEDLYYLKNQLAGGGGGSFEFKVNGKLTALASRLPFRRIDAAFVMPATTLSKWGMFLELGGGSGGTLEADVRKYKKNNTPITEIAAQFTGSINSIARAGSAGSTQSITRSTTQISTQSITFWKSAINVSSIILIGGNTVRYNLASAPDSGYAVGDYVTFASCTSGANNGLFVIVALNSDGGSNIDITNASGVAQTGAAGNAQLMAMSYNQINPVSTEFAATEKALFAAHTSAVNDGNLVIYAINQGGNNLIVKNSAGVTQGGVAGTVDVLRFMYTLAATVSTDIVVGETALFASHTSSVNDGNLPVRAISGSTLTVYNVTGATQGGVAGSVDSNRWIYALASDPSASFTVGQTFYGSTAITAYQNQGVKTVVQVNRSAVNNLVVHNESGVAQGGAAGTVTHTRRLVKFAADQSANYIVTKSRVLLKGVPDSNYLSKEFDVKEVNRGGGANFNIVIDDMTGLGVAQASPAGVVAWESRSVFSTRPLLSVGPYDDMNTATNAVLDSTEKVIAAGSILAMEIIQLPGGNPENLAVQVA